MKKESYFDFSGCADRYDGNVGSLGWYNNPDSDCGFDEDGSYCDSKKKHKHKKKHHDDFDSFDYFNNDDDDDSYREVDYLGF